MMNQCEEKASDEEKVCETKEIKGTFRTGSTQSRIRGSYENKIRFFSPPHKIFEVFSSVKDADGKLSMSYIDLLRAITPYNYGEL